MPAQKIWESLSLSHFLAICIFQMLCEVCYMNSFLLGHFNKVMQDERRFFSWKLLLFTWYCWDYLYFPFFFLSFPEQNEDFFFSSKCQMCKCSKKSENSLPFFSFMCCQHKRFSISWVTAQFFSYDFIDIVVRNVKKIKTKSYLDFSIEILQTDYSCFKKIWYCH